MRGILISIVLDFLELSPVYIMLVMSVVSMCLIPLIEALVALPSTHLLRTEFHS